MTTHEHHTHPEEINAPPTLSRDERNTLIVRANGELDLAFALAHAASGMLHPWSPTYDVAAAVDALAEALRAARVSLDVFTRLESP